VCAYGLAAALSLVLADRARSKSHAGAIAAWALAGPDAELAGLASLLPAALDDPALYEHAYDCADAKMSTPLP
jgi:hypothetical protein